MRNERRFGIFVFGLVFLAVSAFASQGGGKNAFSGAAAARGLVAVIVSANAEWKTVRAEFPAEQYEKSPFGDFFRKDIKAQNGTLYPVLFFQGGWGKVSAAASAQYVIDRWKPAAIVNLGTCGGFMGAIERGTFVLAERTIIYDIIERMGNADVSIDEMSTTIDLSWLKGPLPQGVVRGKLVSGDQDLDPAGLPRLREKYGAAAGDWESGAIAYVASRNRVRLLILRGVSDLVNPAGGEAYGNLDLFERNTRSIMRRLLSDLPFWLDKLAGR
jgi:adenosylhomocysteine nucleosidase